MSDTTDTTLRDDVTTDASTVDDAISSLVETASSSTASAFSLVFDAFERSNILESLTSLASEGADGTSDTALAKTEGLGFTASSGPLAFFGLGHLVASGAAESGHSKTLRADPTDGSSTGTTSGEGDTTPGDTDTSGAAGSGGSSSGDASSSGDDTSSGDTGSTSGDASSSSGDTPTTGGDAASGGAATGDTAADTTASADQGTSGGTTSTSDGTSATDTSSSATTSSGTGRSDTATADTAGDTSDTTTVVSSKVHVSAATGTDTSAGTTWHFGLFAGPISDYVAVASSKTAHTAGSTATEDTTATTDTTSAATAAYDLLTSDTGASGSTDLLAVA